MFSLDELQRRENDLDEIIVLKKVESVDPCHLRMRARFRN